MHVVRLGRGLVEWPVRLPSLEERHARALAAARGGAAARDDAAKEEQPGGDGEADDEREVRADALAEGGVLGRPGGVAAHFDEVGVRLGGVVRRGEELDVGVFGVVCGTFYKVAEVDVGVDIANCGGKWRQQ